MLKLGPHIILSTPHAIEWAKKASIVKCLDQSVEVFSLIPTHAIRIFRHYFPDQALTASPQWLCSEILTGLKGYRHPNLYVEVLNEVPREYAASQLESLKGVVPLLHEAGVMVCGPSWATGDCNQEEWGLFRYAAWAGMDAIAIHCYWADKGFTPWNALRYRQYWCPLDPPILLTELGRDRIRDGDNNTYIGNAGWIADNLNAEQYIVELKAYDYQVSQDHYVLGGAVFTEGATPDFKNFDTGSLPLEQLTGAPTYTNNFTGEIPKEAAMEDKELYKHWRQSGGNGKKAGFIVFLHDIHKPNWGEPEAYGYPTLETLWEEIKEGFR